MNNNKSLCGRCELIPEGKGAIYQPGHDGYGGRLVRLKHTSNLSDGYTLTHSNTHVSTQPHNCCLSYKCVGMSEVGPPLKSIAVQNVIPYFELVSVLKSDITSLNADYCYIVHFTL